MAYRDNNFDFIRLISAIFVLIGHSCILTAHSPPFVLGEGLHEFAVRTFFVISGYFVAKSWDRTRNFKKYLIKRCLRIFPALIFCVLFTAFVLGPIFSNLEISAYFHSPLFKNYLLNCFLYVHYTLPGVFTSNIYPHVVNGSLWTLPVEFLAYLFLPFLAMSLRINRILFWILSALFVVAYFVSYYFDRNLQPVIYGIGLIDSIRLLPFFVVGAAFYFFKTLFRLLNIQVALIMILFLSVLSAFPVHFSPILFPALHLICIPYIVLSFGFAKPPIFSFVSKYGDYSYGIYLYAFPMQQIAVFFWNAHLLYNLLFSLLSSFALAFLSWHLIEKKMLSLKPR